MRALGSRFSLKSLIRLAAILALPLALASCGINDIPTKQEAAKEKWADVQSAYQRRSDLIPNLVATVKGYAAQEKSVLVEVTEARASATQLHVDPSKIPDAATVQKFEQSQNQLSGALGRLLLVQERYPDLKSNENFLALQSQLEGTENRINVARRDYNLAVQDYNTTLRVLPTSIWHATFYSGAQPMSPFSATAAAQSAPSVSFDTSAPPAPGGTAPAAVPGAAPGSPPPAAP